MSHIVVGRVVAAHGIRGEIYIRLRHPDPAWLTGLKALALRRPASITVEELAIIQLRPHRQGFIAELSTLQDRTAAEQWCGAELLIAEDKLVAAPGETPYLHELQGCSLWRERAGERQCLGVITDFHFNGLYDLLVVKTEQGSVEIPFVADWVLDMDLSQQQVVMKLGDEFADPKFWQG